MSEEKDEKSIQDYISDPSPDEVQPAVAEETKEAEQVETPEPEQQEVVEDETSGLSEGLKKRFSKLTADKHRLKSAAEEAERKAAELEARLQRYETPIDEAPREPLIDDPDINWDEPKLRESHQKWVIETSKWAAKQAIGEYEQRGAVDRIQQSRKALWQDHMTRVEKSSVEGYFDKAAALENYFAKENLTIPGYFVEAIQRAKKGPEIVDFLSANPKRAIEIARMGIVQAGLEIGELNAKIANGKPLQKSNAPPPVKPVKGSGVKPKDTSSFSVHDWVHADLKEIGINDR